MPGAVPCADLASRERRPSIARVSVPAHLTRRVAPVDVARDEIFTRNPGPGCRSVPYWDPLPSRRHFREPGDGADSFIAGLVFVPPSDHQDGYARGMGT